MTDDKKNISVIYDHCRTVYEAMFDRARRMQLGDQDVVVYEGRLTHLFAELRMSTPYYTKLKNALIQMGCIEQQRRGGGSTPSQWLLVKEPNEQDFLDMRERRPPASMQQQALRMVKDLAARMDVVEKALGINQKRHEHM